MDSLLMTALAGCGTITFGRSLGGLTVAGAAALALCVAFPPYGRLWFIAAFTVGFGLVAAHGWRAGQR